MDQDPHRPTGLRPTLRQGMILVIYFALLFTYLAATVRSGLPDWSFVAQMLSFASLMTPMTLALLYAFLDRPGPVRNWIVNFASSLHIPALVILINLNTALLFLRAQSYRFMLVGAILMDLRLIQWFLRDLPARLPSRCPRCGRRSLIPEVTRLARATKDLRTRWCASCGSRYRKTPGGDWEEIVVAEPTD